MSYKVLTDIGIIAQYSDTGIEELEDARERARMYFAQGYTVEIRDEETEESIEVMARDEDEDE